MEKKNKIILSGILLVSFAIFGFALISSSTNNHISNSNVKVQTEQLGFKDTVCFYKGHVGVAEKTLIACNHNILYNQGRNMTRDSLIVGSASNAVTTISLCNSTANLTGSSDCMAPTAAGTENFKTFPSGICGLGAGAGTTSILSSTPGNWTITKTFTSTCDAQSTNVTILSNSTLYNFSGSTFPTTTLYTNDQLTINWTISIP